MHIPAGTGTVARLLDVTEPQLNDLIRRGRIPAPKTVVGGRRQWTAPDVEAAAEALNATLPDWWQDSDANSDSISASSLGRAAS